MKIVLLEPLGISESTLSQLSSKLKQDSHEFISYDSFSTDISELITRSAGADILMLANHPLKKEVIESVEQLKFISVAFVGVDHVDLAACKEKGVHISNTGGYCSDAVAELAIGLALDGLRNISAGDMAVKSGKGKAGLQGHELKGKTVGIIGTGAIGCQTANLFKAFGCKIKAYSRSQNKDFEYLPLDELMQQCDIISIHTPLNNQSRDLIGEHELNLMKPGAILINTARGPVVNTKAIADILKEGKIVYATDVFDYDPPLAADYPLMSCPNLICTPHVGFDTRESIDRRAEMAFENVYSYLSGEIIRKML